MVMYQSTLDLFPRLTNKFPSLFFILLSKPKLFFLISFIDKSSIFDLLNKDFSDLLIISNIL